MPDLVVCGACGAPLTPTVITTEAGGRATFLHPGPVHLGSKSVLACVDWIATHEAPVGVEVPGE